MSDRRRARRERPNRSPWPAPVGQQPVSRRLAAWHRKFEFDRVLLSACFWMLVVVVVVWVSWYTSGHMAVTKRLGCWILALGVVQVLNVARRAASRSAPWRTAVAPSSESAVVVAAALAVGVLMTAMLSSPMSRRLVASAVDRTPILTDLPSRSPDTSGVRTTVLLARTDLAETSGGVAVTIDVTANDDPAIDRATVVVVSGIVGSTSVDSTGRITFSPPVGLVGRTSFVYAVCAADGRCARAVVRIAVT